jgi:NhaP-type Na+/H+ or K+/H+ antiporter
MSGTPAIIGLQLPTLIRALSQAEAWPAEALAVAGTLIAIRILWVFPLSAILQRRSGARRPSLAIPAVVSWAGTRGVVPLAAALSIPLTSASGAPLAQRDLVLVLATAVIVVSLIVQGSLSNRWPGSPGSPAPPTPATRKPWPGCAWPRRPWPGSMNSPTMTPPPMR